MSTESNEALPPGVIRLRIRGNFRLNREPQAESDGWKIFYLNAAKVDVFDSCNAAYRQLFGDKPTPESDRRYLEVMAARAAREKGAA